MKERQHTRWSDVITQCNTIISRSGLPVKTMSATATRVLCSDRYNIIAVQWCVIVPSLLLIVTCVSRDGEVNKHFQFPAHVRELPGRWRSHLMGGRGGGDGQSHQAGKRRHRVLTNTCNIN